MESETPPIPGAEELAEKVNELIKNWKGTRERRELVQRELDENRCASVWLPVTSS